MKALTQRMLLGMTTAITIGLAPAIAFAHGKLESADPAAGSTIDAPAGPLRLTFNEDLEPAFSNVTVADASGTAVTKEKAKVDSTNPRVLTVAVPKLASGSYDVRWTVMTHDGHKVKGDYKFAVK
ncbi:copper homeostasis periplasmic binding protein CopC [Cupriavidus sp. CV2]|jgi:methionine-rich copper-binding protein CopC|uniref:copper homeostasis periplasmic binding protein CopC n=1 Tax=Cupriavidus ulmosensis TaxID=3065913 RepID=UPI00296AF44E|nr:copper homeostasis periplasmic binding protein CopC [Cupriavidus sp. CV2]MDW3688950.1 copper homeostasis periplasmic binding protein CopC [Cupriavidus sp. CV2]